VDVFALVDAVGITNALVAFTSKYVLVQLPPMFINGSDSTTDPECDLLVSLWKPEDDQPIATKWTL